MRTAVSPGQWHPLDSCFALIGAHQHGIAVGSMNRENPHVSCWVGARGGYSHTFPIRVCAAQRGRDFEAPDFERGIKNC